METLNSDLTVEMKIERIREQQRNEEKDCLVQELPLIIIFNGEEYATLYCSPQKLDYLAVGFLYLEGLLHGKDDLAGIEIAAAKGRVAVRTKTAVATSEKGTGPKVGDPGNIAGQAKTALPPAMQAVEAQSDPGEGERVPFAQVLASLQGRRIETALQVEAEELFRLMDDLLGTSAVFKTTGGVHSAALALPDQILFFSEDIGRHNAVDKIVGEALLKGISLKDKILLSSGRISAEIVVKGAKLGLPLIVSCSAPTSLSVELAAKAGMTLVGFVRGRRLNIYAHAYRVNGSAKRSFI